MAAQHPRATLIHNAKAGDRRHSPAQLIQLLQRAGYCITYVAAKDGDLAGALARPAELIVAAGGDGTMARVAAHARSDGPPIAILPLGTANNVANSLGVVGPLEDLVTGWPACRRRPYYPICVSGPWGTRRLTEGIGCGAFEQAMHELPHKLRLKEAREALRKAVIEAPPECLEVGIGNENESIAGLFAVFEITAIPLIGPRLPLAPAADPSDRCFDICFIGDSCAERQGFAQWLENAERTESTPVALRRARCLTIAGQFCRIRLDGKLWTAEADGASGKPWPVIGIATEPQPLHFLVPA